MSTLIGSIGVALLLLAFFLNLFGFLATTSRIYSTMNLVGGSLSAFASYLIDFMPFVVLEGTWAIVALVALMRPRALAH
jgi:hypothetical protein